MKRDSFVYKLIKKAENPPDNWFWRQANELFCTVSIIYGHFVFRKLRKKYPNETLVVASLMSLGDILYLKFGLDDLLHKICASQYRIIMNKRCERNVRMLGYDNVSFMRVGSVGALNMYIHFLNDKIPNVVDAYAWCLFDLQYAGDNLKIKHPEFPIDEQKIALAFRELDAKPGITVIISPYEQSLTANGYRLLPRLFWESVVEKLISRGYHVLTNCSGSATEPPIKGTMSVFPPCSDLINYISYAGGLIAIRSGLVDFCCRANAKKVVLYPNDCFFHTNDMGLSDDVIELNYENIDFTNLDAFIDTVIAAFPEVNKC